MDEDLKEKPEWEKYTPKFSVWGGSSSGVEKKSGGCPFHLK